MKPRTFAPTPNLRSIFTLTAIAVLLAACAPQAVTEAPAANPPQQPPVQQPATEEPAASQPAEQPAATEAPAQQDAPAAVPTSRGDKLQATDPVTVSLASGGLQLIEFFRFT